jgi:alpha-D-ribose 1-methylphosphonate 5-triphosphate synthase subunit PhnG
MQACTIASEQELAAAVTLINPAIDVIDVRQPEIGLLMLRGRIGGDGAPFNVGEATVTRSVVRLGTGEIGYSYLFGRSEKRARLAAILDALGQASPEYSAQLDEKFVASVTMRAASENREKSADTAGTRVNFFALARGED